MSKLDYWTSELPLSWEYKPLKAVSSYNVSNVDKLSSENEIPVYLCNYTDVYNNEFLNFKIQFMQATATPHEISRFKLHENDIIITKDSESWMISQYQLSF